MTDVIAPKRKASEVEDLSAVDPQDSLNKRARKNTEEAAETVEDTSEINSENDLEDDFTTLEKDSIQIKRTRGIRVDYAELQADTEDNHGEEEDDDEEEEEEDEEDQDQDEEEGATDQGQVQNVELNAGATYKNDIGENGTKGEQESEEDVDNDSDNYAEDDEDED